VLIKLISTGPLVKVLKVTIATSPAEVSKLNGGFREEGFVKSNTTVSSICALT
jgi:hypothetical protein